MKIFKLLQIHSHSHDRRHNFKSSKKISGLIGIYKCKDKLKIVRNYKKNRLHNPNRLRTGNNKAITKLN